MAAVTYYVALPFVWSEDGELVRGRSARAADVKCSGLGGTVFGSHVSRRVAFSRTGNPSTGDFSDAEIIRSSGAVPDISTLLAAP